ncbi:hypothetical protein ABID99_005794 [Mucilaginibacter sp. OAE612]
MSRNAKSTMELVFDTIKLHAQPNPLPYPKEWNYDRWVYGDMTEFAWLTTTKLYKSVDLSFDIKLSLFDFDQKRYFVTTGLSEPEIEPKGFVNIGMNAGLFTLVVSEFELSVVKDITANYIDNYILSQSLENKPYKGHDYTDLVRLFPTINAFELTADFPGDSNNIAQIAAIFVSSNAQYSRLSFSKAALKQLSALSYVNSEVLIYDNILQALFSSNFKFAFLDLYRCVEMLFQLIYIDDMHAALPAGVSKIDLLNAVDDALGWKPIERQSVSKIFEKTPPTELTALIGIIKKVSGKTADHSGWYYDLRCQIVHLKTKQKTIEIDNTTWNQLIEGSCQLLCYWYNHFQKLT